MEEIMLKIENVSKKYKLGQIGGTTLYSELQRLNAKLHHREDPTKKIGAKNYNKGETFMALNEVSFEVKKGERVGIIGHNGAGKSTLLKLLSRVTAPTSGTIAMNGRVASMLEVGTGFHGELTGRENIYMNGAILGMTKKEIDSKIEDIIDFSEVREFIDTPVKRYSSGMYVKLAFSVAAHLDSEIMIMDEVLAVGDMAFQKKCLEKMNDVSKTEGRTILYVSHNMNTIRQLCDRCVVLNHGRVVFDGGVEEGINHYLGLNGYSPSEVDLSIMEREKGVKDPDTRMTKLVMLVKDGIYALNSLMSGKLYVHSKHEYDDVNLEIFLLHNGVCVTSFESGTTIRLKKNGVSCIPFQVSLDRLAPAKYTVKLVLSRRNGLGVTQYLDAIMQCYYFEIVEPDNFHGNQNWSISNNGFLLGDDILIGEENC